MSEGMVERACRRLGKSVKYLGRLILRSPCSCHVLTDEVIEAKQRAGELSVARLHDDPNRATNAAVDKLQGQYL